MRERIVGTVRIENAEGDIERVVDAPIGEMTIIGGILGSLVIDAWVEPPKIQGKGNVFLLNADGTKVRTRRLNLGEILQVVMAKGEDSDHAEIGEISYVTLQE